MGKSSIEWTDSTWNPVTGCTPCSVGCERCYAKRMATRLAGRYGYPADEPFRVTLHPDRLNEPVRWKKPRRVFVCSMGDLFHKDVPFPFVYQVMQEILRSRQHTYLILTKRPDRMAEFFNEHLYRTLLVETIPRLWLGTSISTQTDADRAIPHLLRCPAAVRFLSCEPLLEEIDLASAIVKRRLGDPQPNWVIVGGESGPRRRPCKLDWIRSIRDQCVAAGVPLFVKQAEIDGRLVKMPEIDGKVWSELP